MNTRNVSLDEAGTALHRMNLVGLSPRPIDLLPLLQLGGLTQLWSCEAANADWAERFDVEPFSLEAMLNVRGRWRSADLDALLPYVTQRAMGSMNSLVPFGLTDQWRAALAGHKQLVVVPSLSAESRREWNDKIFMRLWLQSLGVPLPSSMVVAADDLNFRQLSRQFGSPNVLQVPTGSAGIGTYLVGGSDDIEGARLQYPKVLQWLASSYAGDTTLNFHGLVTSDGETTVTNPSVQLSGLTATGAGFGEYCGSDFQAPYVQPDQVLHECREIVRRIGVSLASNNYRGIFGVDLAIQGTTVVVLEVNSRIQASTWLLGEIELEQRLVPTLCWHVLSGQEFAVGPKQLGAPSDGVQLVIRHTDSRQSWLVRVPPAGVYVRQGGGLVWRRSGAGLLDCGAGEVVVTDLPQPGVRVHPGAVLGRLVTRTSLTSSDGLSLTSEGTALLAAFHASVELNRCDEALLDW